MKSTGGRVDLQYHELQLINPNYYICCFTFWRLFYTESSLEERGMHRGKPCGAVVYDESVMDSRLLIVDYEYSADSQSVNHVLREISPSTGTVVSSLLIRNVSVDMCKNTKSVHNFIRSTINRLDNKHAVFKIAVVKIASPTAMPSSARWSFRGSSLGCLRYPL
jgi:hypothetical protein